MVHMENDTSSDSSVVACIRCVHYFVLFFMLQFKSFLGVIPQTHINNWNLFDPSIKINKPSLSCFIDVIKMLVS